MPTLPDWAVPVLPVVAVLVAAPLVSGRIARAGAIVRQRRGASVPPPYRGLLALWHKEAVLPEPAGGRSGAAVRLDWRELAAIFVGGAAGAVVRVRLAELGAHGAPSWPWATFGVNLVGSFALGYLVTRLQERLPLSTYRRPFVGTGLCGALTTFSTMQLELLRMLEAHRYGLAAGYASASIVAGYLSIHLATSLVRRVRALA